MQVYTWEVAKQGEAEGEAAESWEGEKGQTTSDSVFQRKVLVTDLGVYNMLANDRPTDFVWTWLD